MTCTTSSVLKCRKSDLVQHLLWLNNKPYDLKGREPLKDIYDLEDVGTLLMMGRQYAKSTFQASDMLINSIVFPFFKTLYVSPRQDQTSEFSNAKLQPFMRYSPIFKKLYLDDGCTDNVGKKTFNNGSEITLKYAYHSADAIRGVSADHTRIDEVQDIILSNIPVIEEALSGSPYQWRTYSGTPKTLNNTLAQKWNQSTQNEWVLRCTGCRKWNIIGIENIGPECLVCKKCGKPLPPTSHGKWVAKKELRPDMGVFLVGFRVPQVLSPMVKWERIIEKMRTYPIAKFQNEVLASPYDSSANPITEAELRNVCVLGKNTLTLRPDMEGTHLFLGVDWGHGDVSIKSRRGEQPSGFTVLSLGRYNYDGKFELLGMKKYVGAESDPTFQVNEICQIANRLKVIGVGVDFGGGFMHNAQLRRMLGTDRIIEWQATDNLRVTARWIPEAGRMQFNRTECMTDRFVEIKNSDVKFFCWEDFRQFSPDFLTIVVDYRDDGRSLFYNHVLCDDCFHSYMLCKMTADYLLRA